MSITHISYLCSNTSIPMIFLLLSLFFSTCIFFTFKYFNKFGISILPAITVNYLMASAFGYFSIAETTTVNSMAHQSWFLMAAITGVAFILTFFVFAVSTQKVGVAMTVVSGKMSIVLSVAVGIFMIAEPFSFLQFLGIIAALVAFYLTNKGRSEEHVDKKYLYLPVLIFLGTGANDSLMKLSGVYYADRNEIEFLTVTFFTAFTIGLGFLLYQIFRNSLKITWKDILAGILLSIFNWYSTYFFIKGLYVLPISFFVPVFNAALVFIAAVSGYFFFGEKLSVLNRIGIVLAMLAIAAIAFS
jgi:drug/metabolite transporter (DMT)-like permease